MSNQVLTKVQAELLARRAEGLAATMRRLCGETHPSIKSEVRITEVRKMLIEFVDHYDLSVEAAKLIFKSH